MDLSQLDLVPPPNLLSIPLSIGCKKKLVEKTQQADSCYLFVMNKYNVKYYTLRKYYKKVRKDLPMFESGGRPGRLDLISCDFILNFMAHTEAWDKYDIHDRIRQEVLATLMRRYPNGNAPQGTVKASQATVRRWASKLITLHQQQLNEL